MTADRHPGLTPLPGSPAMLDGHSLLRDLPRDGFGPLPVLGPLQRAQEAVRASTDPAWAAQVIADAQAVEGKGAGT